MDTFKEDCIWMSCRYAIGRSSIASCTHPYNVIRHGLDWIGNEHRQKALAKDIRCHLNERLAFHGHVNSPGYSDKHDFLSCILKYMKDVNVSNPNLFYASHKFDIDSYTGVVLNCESLDQIKPDVDLFSFSNLYYDYEGWILLANLLDESKHVTLRVKYNNKTVEHKCLLYYKLYSDGVGRHYIDINEFKKNPYPIKYLTIKDIIDNEF